MLWGDLEFDTAEKEWFMQQKYAYTGLILGRLKGGIRIAQVVESAV